MAKVSILLIGFGENKKHLAPALKELEESDQSIEVTIVDQRPFKELGPEEMEGYREWAEARFFQEQSGESFVDSMKGKMASEKRIIYLAIPPNAFEKTIKKYLTCGNIFIIEKPWALNRLQFLGLYRIAQANPQLIILGMDHYSWKAEVIAFKKRIIDQGFLKRISSLKNFDCILCEPELDSVKRSYFWQTGITLDMIPHVLPLLDDLFRDCSYELVKIIPRICSDTTVVEVLNKYEMLFPVKETYSELILRVKAKGSTITGHIILSKGCTMTELRLCGEISDSFKFFYAEGGKIFLDLTRHEIVMDCTKERIQEIHNPWYTMFNAVIDSQYGNFVSMKRIEQYSTFYEEIQKGLHEAVEELNAKREHDTSEYARILLRDERCWYPKGKVKRVILHDNCCLT